jgi:hypothetical protein
LIAVGQYPAVGDNVTYLVQPKQIMICNHDKSVFSTFKFTPQSNLTYQGSLELQKGPNSNPKKGETYSQITAQDEYHNLITLSLKVCIDLKINYFAENTGCCLYVNFTQLYNFGLNGKLAFIVGLISSLKQFFGEKGMSEDKMKDQWRDLDYTIL